MIEGGYESERFAIEGLRLGLNLELTHIAEQSLKDNQMACNQVLHHLGYQESNDVYSSTVLDSPLSLPIFPMMSLSAVPT